MTAAQKKKITSLKEEIASLKDENTKLTEAQKVEIVEPCKRHGVKECANLKCIPKTEVDKA